MGPATEDVLEPEFAERVLAEPLAESLGLEAVECRCTVLAVNDDDVFWGELVQE